MILAQIVAISMNNAIGKENKLLWHYPEDLKYFKNQTLGKIMIMGRKTFDSFGGKPLPKRWHIVISRHPNSSVFENVIYVTSFEEAKKIAHDLIKSQDLPEEVMVIGGAEIYKLALAECQKLYITQIHKKYEADAFYPDNYKNLFEKISERKSEVHPELVYQIWIRK